MADAETQVRATGIEFDRPDCVEKPKPILLVGEANPYGSEPRFALYPLPEKASGGRLARILGLTNLEYLARHDRVNLCPGKWSIRTARWSATQVLAVRRPGSGIVLLGTKVAQAFGLEKHNDIEGYNLGGVKLLCIPHPSGLCRAWNDPTLVPRVREIYESLWKDAVR